MATTERRYRIVQKAAAAAAMRASAEEQQQQQEQQEVEQYAPLVFRGAVEELAEAKLAAPKSLGKGSTLYDRWSAAWRTVRCRAHRVLGARWCMWPAGVNGWGSE